MSHAVIPNNFPADPDIGDTHTFHNGVWTYGNLGWVKTKVVLTSNARMYPGLLTHRTNPDDD